MSDLYNKTYVEKTFEKIQRDISLVKSKLLGTAKSANVYPRRASWFFIDGVGTTLERNSNYTSAEHKALWSQVSEADGDSWTFSAVLAVGSYTFHAKGRKGTAAGILDYYLDGTAIETGQDWYAAAASDNETETFTFSVATAGYHIFRLTVNGKTGSDYRIMLTRLWITPTAD